MSVVSDVVAYLIATNPTAFTSTNTYGDQMPTSPAACMCVYQYAGRGPEFNTDGDMLSHPQLQIKVRYPSGAALNGVSAAWTWMKQAETALLSVKNSTLTGTRYQYIRPSATAFMNGWTNNSIFIIQNFEACRSE